MSQHINPTPKQTDIAALNSNKADVANLSYGSYTYTNQAEMEAGLVNLVATLGANKTTVIYLYPNYGVSMFAGAPGVATIVTGISTSYFSVLFHNYGGVFYGKYINGTWTWDSLALNSNFIRSVVQGKIADSSSGNFNGLGCATVLLFPNHKAVITYSYKLTDESADNSNFSYGLNSQLLRELDTSLPNITPVAGGKWRCYKNDGTLLFSLLGYGTRHEINGTRWTLSRLYNTSGSTGPWSANELKTGYYIEGICLATY